MWSESLTETWRVWQSLFSLRGLPTVPHVSSVYLPAFTPDATAPPSTNQPTSYTSRLMQHLGVSLWQWLFDGPIQSSFNQSQGIAIGQGRPLRLRLQICDPSLIELPWEIMQPQPGKQAVSLSQQILFSRTTNDVDPLPLLRLEQSLKILLVLGQDSDLQTNAPDMVSGQRDRLDLEQEAASLSQLLESVGEGNPRDSMMTLVSCQVTTLVQPTPAELIDCLEAGSYNILFYAGHGMPGPDGGMLFLHPNAAINGTELAQVLVRCQVKLAVFNACWGAQPDLQGEVAIPRSSLAEVLIHHGVPAVLGMRDSISDQEALSFVQVFAQKLAERLPIDEAVAIARQHLLTLYKFNQPAWTLPVLYMHPEFNGELIRPFTEGVTEIPDHSASWIGRQFPPAVLRTMTPPVETWHLRGGTMRVGRGEANDVILLHPGVSREHAEIFYRESSGGEDAEPTYLLRDRSRYGTWILSDDGWHKVHHQEIPLHSATQLKFGNPRSQPLEFIIERMPSS
jgi:hypothetical protein